MGSATLPSRVWFERVRPLLDLALPSLLEPLKEEPKHGPSTGTCATLDIPKTAASAYLFAAAAAVGDVPIAEQLCNWLRNISRRELQTMWIPEGRDWSAFCTAQLLYGLSCLRGASLQSVSCMSTCHHLVFAEGAQVLRAESTERGLYVSINPTSGSERIALKTDF